MGMSLEEKKKLLAGIVKKTQEKSGGSKHVLAFASDRVDELAYEYIPTPSENVNMALGNGTVPGGILRGKITEIAGESSSGKTSLMLETIGLDHKLNPNSVWGWLDTEGDYDAEYATMKGIDPDRLILWEVDDAGAENGLDTLEMMIRSHALTGIVVNSVTGLTPSAELDAEMGKNSIALQARMMSRLMRKITAISNRTKTSVVFINQLRVNVGQMFGNPNTTTGGKALQYFTSQRVSLNKVKIQKEDGITEEEGIKINVRIMKNRAAYDNPYKVTSYTALFGEGIDSVREIAQIVQDVGYATSGSWIYIDSNGAPSKDNCDTWKGTELKFNGKAKFLNFIREDPEFHQHLKDMIQGKVVTQQMSEDEVNALQAQERALEEELKELGAEE